MFSCYSLKNKAQEVSTTYLAASWLKKFFRLNLINKDDDCWKKYQFSAKE